MTAISFFVPGKPQTAGSKRAFVIRKAGVYTGRAIVTDANAKSKDWKSDVRGEAQRSYSGPPLEGPLLLKATFNLIRPRSHFRSGKNSHLLKETAPLLPDKKPDTTKLLRAVEDALTGILWNDDAQVTTQIAAKRFHARAGAQIEVFKESITNHENPNII